MVKREIKYEKLKNEKIGHATFKYIKKIKVYFSKNDLPSYIINKTFYWDAKYKISRNNDLPANIIYNKNPNKFEQEYVYRYIKYNTPYRYNGYSNSDHPNVKQYNFIRGLCIEHLKEELND